MRPRDVRIPLFDMLQAADAVAAFLADRTWEQYQDDLMLRSAVERQFEILGEAMTRVLRIEPALEVRLEDARGVVDFRNVIAHDYDRLSDRAVWDIAQDHLPALREAVAAVLEERR
jgi:uncharacterized protein with HEPN domain